MLSVKTQCYHCGEECNEGLLTLAGKDFCCNGCMTVFQILHQNEMDNYYCLNERPGSTVQEITEEKFAFLDEADIKMQLLEFSNAKMERVTLYLPQIHCSSCLWLLEHLNQLESKILQSQINFATKKISVSYETEGFSLRQLAELLARIGYEPHIELNPAKEETKGLYSSKQNTLKLGIIGFCFANIMLISFPEYLGMKHAENPVMSNFFKWANLLLSLPVVFYGGKEFFVNTWYSFRQRYLNIDAPIALAIAVTFIRSVYEVVSQTGAGYFDSMSGIVFFMLLGRTLQNRTYSTLSFTKDYLSYFPITVSKVEDSGIQQVKIESIKEGDILRIHHQEVIPTDCMLSKGDAYIDYSFITGEAAIESIPKAGLIYAGGKNAGGVLELLVVKPFSQNSFTGMWNNKAFQKEETSERELMTTKISKYFSLVVVLIALSSFFYWQWLGDAARAWNAATAVLIIACPCTLLLTATFTNGYLLDWLSRRGIFLKNAQVIEKIANTNFIAFDKTGTITDAGIQKLEELQMDLTPQELDLALHIMSQSLHPLSIALVKYYGYAAQEEKYVGISIKEVLGKGLEAWYADQHIKIGSYEFVSGQVKTNPQSEVWIGIDQKIKAGFGFSVKLKKGVLDLFQKLHPKFHLSLISGDNNSAQQQMEKIFPEGSEMTFNCKPEEKLNLIAALQEKGNKVMMIGDGLNDAGALKQSDVGVALVHNAFSFTPACDVIMKAADIHNLYALIQTSRNAQRFILIGFAYSIIFNIIGLSFAVMGNLVPLIAAIIMPASSLGIILIAFISIQWATRKNFDGSQDRLIH